MTEAEIIRTQADRILASGELGKSRIYTRLFSYLVDCTINVRSPKELEIAIDVFDKDATFDVGKDATIRVYIHKLRKKLEQYYQQPGKDQHYQLTIPHGQYRFRLEPRSNVVAPALETGRGILVRNVLLGVVVVLLLVNAWLLAGHRDTTNPYFAQLETIADHPFWAPLMDDDLPILVVLGDYFIFAELDEYAETKWLVRDFDINSARELDNYLLDHPEMLGQFLNLDLTYLPTGSSFALRDLYPVATATGKTVRLTLMSELNTADLKSHHVIYIGYLSALDKLRGFFFNDSSLAIGDTYDELVHKPDGEVFVSEAGFLQGGLKYRDYGMVSTVPGPAGANRFVMIAGTRDTGLMHIARALTNIETLDELWGSLPPDNRSEQTAFEALYEVTGIDRTDLDGQLVFATTLNTANPGHQADLLE